MHDDHLILGFMMRLTFARPFLSLNELPLTELPPFTMIVGKNGAGKTHLLKALQNGSVSADVAPQAAQDIRLFDWSNLAPPDEADFDVASLRQDLLPLYNQVQNLLRQQPWGDQAIFANASNFFSGRYASDLSWLGSLTDEKISKTIKPGVDQAPDAIRASVEQSLLNADNSLAPFLQPHQIDYLRGLSATVKKPIASISYDDFFRAAKPAWGVSDLFQQSFGRLFVAYRELYQMNRLAQVAFEEGDENAPALSKEAFQSEFGSPPWDFVNDALKAADLDFTISSPSLYSTGPYKPRLYKKDVGAEITFGGLSSGERILMSFAFALYYASDSRQAIRKPKLLLFDEIDAPLHPSMCKSLINTIQNVLVERQGLCVIMTLIRRRPPLLSTNRRFLP